jgi:hypothetical protein
MKKYHKFRGKVSLFFFSLGGRKREGKFERQQHDYCILTSHCPTVGDKAGGDNPSQEMGK